MTVPMYNQKELWSLSPSKFNEWRQKNDLPLLFEYFKKKLPGFEEWFKAYEPEEGYFLKLVPTGDLFKGNSNKIIAEYERSDCKGLITEVVSSLDEITIVSKRFKHVTVDIKRTTLFVPYLLWGQRKYKKKKFIVYDLKNNQRSDSFVYSSWVTDQNGQSRAKLFGDFFVLKLGGMEIKNGKKVSAHIPFYAMNLDFVDLDGLTIDGYGNGPKWANISFSSLDNVKFMNEHFSFFSFFDCYIENMLVKDGKSQDFRFINNKGMSVKFDHVQINKVLFDNSTVGMNFEGCDIISIDYRPPKINNVTGIFHNYRKIRTAFQNIGKRAEASRFYYLERYYETKIIASTMGSDRDSFPLKRKYNGTFNDIIDQFKNGEFGFKESMLHFLSVLWFCSRVLFTPKYFVRLFGNLLKFIVLFFDYLIWGYGERPSRTFILAILTIAFFTNVFYNSSHVNLHGSLINSIYFSISTFTTLGYSDIGVGGDSALRVPCSIEALLGVFIVALFVAGFANRSKY